jgi:dinuclear metal center YbgI/SA1388 family protein
MKASEIAAIIEEFAPLEIQESWDNSGFCIGSPEQEIKGILLGFDCTPSLINEAILLGANMIITHHPLLFGGIKKISPDNRMGESIYLALKNDIVVYSAHTNADKVINGVSGLMAGKLSLLDVEFLDESGMGVVGNLPCKMATGEFIDYIKRQFSLKIVRCSEPISKEISKVALCGGSGKSLIGKAIDSGAQAYITGDISYHDFYCEKGFMVIDIGHYESEIDIVQTLLSILLKKIPTFAIHITKDNNNPIYYY